MGAWPKKLRKGASKTMTDEKFKLPQSSYDELAKVIKAYGHFSEPAGLDEISKFIGLHTTIISRNAGFLTVVGILESGARKTPTQIGKSLAHALEHEMPDEIRKWWRQIINGSDFLSKLLSAIKIRSGMDQQTLEAHIAYSAGQPKKPQFMTGARTVIDILRAAELIKETDGKYIADLTAVESFSSHEISSQAITTPPVKRATIPPSQSGANPSINMTIQININCSATDISTLGPQIKKLMAELSSEKTDAQIATEDE